MITCPVCREQTGALLDSRLALSACGTCGHQFATIAPGNVETYGQEYYDDTHRNWFANPDYDLFHRIGRAVTAAWPERNAHLLDVGCGTGVFLQYLLQTNPGYRFTGIDLHRNAHPDIAFICDDFMTYRFDCRFDVITMLAFIEHTSDPSAIMRKAASLMRPGSLIVLMTVDARSFLYTLARGLHRVGISSAYLRLYDRHHLQHFTAGSLFRLVSDHGFTTIHSEHHNPPPAAIDYPSGQAWKQLGFRMAIRSLFRVTSGPRSGYLQTIICKKNG